MASIGDDCYFFYYSACSKGELCPFRHSEAALGTETVCMGWRAGTCYRPYCKFRHMEIQFDRSNIPCYWENQPTGCTKPHCVFKHYRPKTDPPVLDKPEEMPTLKPAELEKAVEVQPVAVPVPKIPSASTVVLQESGQSVSGHSSPVVKPVIVNTLEEDSDHDSIMSSPQKAEHLAMASAKSKQEAMLRRVGSYGNAGISLGSQTGFLAFGQNAEASGVLSLEEIHRKKALESMQRAAALVGQKDVRQVVVDEEEEPVQLKSVRPSIQERLGQKIELTDFNSDEIMDSVERPFVKSMKASENRINLSNKIVISKEKPHHPAQKVVMSSNTDSDSDEIMDSVERPYVKSMKASENRINLHKTIAISKMDSQKKPRLQKVVMSSNTDSDSDDMVDSMEKPVLISLKASEDRMNLQKKIVTSKSDSREKPRLPAQKVVLSSVGLDKEPELLKSQKPHVLSAQGSRSKLKTGIAIEEIKSAGTEKKKRKITLVKEEPGQKSLSLTEIRKKVSMKQQHDDDGEDSPVERWSKPVLSLSELRNRKALRQEQAEDDVGDEEEENSARSPARKRGAQKGISLADLRTQARKRRLDNSDEEDDEKTEFGRKSLSLTEIRKKVAVKQKGEEREASPLGHQPVLSLSEIRRRKALRQQQADAEEDSSCEEKEERLQESMSQKRRLAEIRSKARKRHLDDADDYVQDSPLDTWGQAVLSLSEIRRRKALRQQQAEKANSSSEDDKNIKKVTTEGGSLKRAGLADIPSRSRKQQGLDSEEETDKSSTQISDDKDRETIILSLDEIRKRKLLRKTDVQETQDHQKLSTKEDKKWKASKPKTARKPKVERQIYVPPAMKKAGLMEPKQTSLRMVSESKSPSSACNPKILTQLKPDSSAVGRKRAAVQKEEPAQSNLKDNQKTQNTAGGIEVKSFSEIMAEKRRRRQEQQQKSGLLNNSETQPKTAIFRFRPIVFESEDDEVRSSDTVRSLSVQQNPTNPDLENQNSDRNMKSSILNRLGYKPEEKLDVAGKPMSKRGEVAFPTKKLFGQLNRDRDIGHSLSGQDSLDSGSNTSNKNVLVKPVPDKLRIGAEGKSLVPIASVNAERRKESLVSSVTPMAKRLGKNVLRQNQKTDVISSSSSPVGVGVLPMSISTPSLSPSNLSSKSVSPVSVPTASKPRTKGNLLPLSAAAAPVTPETLVIWEPEYFVESATSSKLERHTDRAAVGAGMKTTLEASKHLPATNNKASDANRRYSTGQRSGENGTRHASDLFDDLLFMENEEVPSLDDVDKVDDLLLDIDNLLE